MHAGARGQKGRPEAIRPFLIFCSFFIKEKEKEEGCKPDRIPNSI